MISLRRVYCLVAFSTYPPAPGISWQKSSASPLRWDKTIEICIKWLNHQFAKTVRSSTYNQNWEVKIIYYEVFFCFLEISWLWLNEKSIKSSMYFSIFCCNAMSLSEKTCPRRYALLIRKSPFSGGLEIPNQEWAYHELKIFGSSLAKLKSF